MSNRRQSRVVRLALSYADTTLTKWAIEKGINPHTAQAAMASKTNGEVGQQIRAQFLADFASQIRIAEDGLISLMPAEYADFFRRTGLEKWAWEHGHTSDDVYAAVHVGSGEILDQVKEAMQYA